MHPRQVSRSPSRGEVWPARMCNAEARALSSGLPGEMGRDSDGRDSDAEPRNTRGDPETRFATDTRFFPWMTVESEAPVCRAPLHFLMKVPKLMGPCSVFLPSSPFFFPARPVAATRAEEVCIHSCRQIPAVGNSRKRWTPHLIREPVTVCVSVSCTPTLCCAQCTCSPFHRACAPSGRYQQCAQPLLVPFSALTRAVAAPEVRVDLVAGAACVVGALPPGGCGNAASGQQGAYAGGEGGGRTRCGEGNQRGKCHVGGEGEAEAEDGLIEAVV